MIKKSEKTAKFYVLRDLVLANGGQMDIVPEVLRSKSFRGWNKSQISSMVFQIRKNFQIGEVWALYQGRIYAREEDMPPDIWGHVCDRRENKLKGVADQNRIYEEKHKIVRPEKDARKVLNKHIDVLGKTMDSALTVVRAMRNIDE